MNGMLNKKISAAIGITDDIDGDHLEAKDEILVPKIVSSTEMPPPIDNPNLPQMGDIDRRMLQAEAELQAIIDAGMIQVRNLYEATSTVDPKYKNRHIGVTTELVAGLVDAIKHKSELQLKKKKLRLEEAKFVGPVRNAPSGEANAEVFIGSREDLRKYLKNNVIDKYVTDEDNTDE